MQSSRGLSLSSRRAFYWRRSFIVCCTVSMSKQPAKRIEAHGAEDNLSLGRPITPDKRRLSDNRIEEVRQSWDGSFAMSDTSAVKSRKPLSLEEFRRQRKPLRNVNKEVSEKLSALDRLAWSITNRVGTMGFFLIVLIWTVLWLGWNLLTPKDLQFDPPMAFVFWLFIDRKSTRLNSSHLVISYAVFC